MRRPICGLCYRTGQQCEYPARRRRPNRKRVEGDDRVNIEPPKHHSRAGESPSPGRCQYGRPERSPSLSTPNAGDRESPFRDEVSPSLSKQLVDLFFSKIQPWLPLLHRRNFYQAFVNVENDQLYSLADMEAEACLLLQCMFALAARYCSVDEWALIHPTDRAEPFIAKAMAAYEYLRRGIDRPSVQYLQGCTLLAFCLCTTDMNHQGWILTGVCVRLAYDLNLHRIDVAHHGESDSTYDWAHKEGLRRLWWLIWELDRFGSILSQRPYGLDGGTAKVLLPVSDANWFANKPVESAMLDPRPQKAWQSLQGSANQNAWAWFIVCNHVVSLTYGSMDRDRDEDSDNCDFEILLACFNLALPQQFDLHDYPLVVNEENRPQYNWVVCTRLLLLSCRALCDMSYSPTPEARVTRLQSRVSELLQIMNSWPTEYIGLCQPFIACTLIGPRSIFVDPRWASARNSSFIQARDITKLGLLRFSRYWKLGKVLLNLGSLIQETPERGEKGLQEYRQRFAALLPDRILSSQLPISPTMRPSSINREHHSSDEWGLDSFGVGPLAPEDEWNGGKALPESGRDDVATSSNGFFFGQRCSLVDQSDGLPHDSLLGATMLPFPEVLPDAPLGEFYAM
ncbi:hypothetical protein FE257_005835 [Aspergillus nanangensis]|uniref:Xylanolytic transcriptional activator regulatory domain-containing protein n=1 Tax=Aspergillus nanangensis TaxID=2582783 RepID=A0AAD4CPQ4_ASPNN|nr:hypothetical protein FE257_005835 [Aspergillus nanangensis]